MNSIINYFVALSRRLAATIPPPSEKNTLWVLPGLISRMVEELTTTQSLQDMAILTVTFVLVMELVSVSVYHIPKGLTSSIPVRGKHLDMFSWKDYLFIFVNKCMTGIFVYCYFGYLWAVRKVEHDHHDHHDHNHNHVLRQHHDRHDYNNEGEEHFSESHCCNGGSGIWALEDLSLTNTILPIPVLLVVYDFFYTLLHWFLHIKSVYAFVHKHHHHQKAPSRANIDAVNVHPLEYFLGEFNHVLALHLVVKGIPLLGFKGMDVSSAGALAFISLGGILAGLNHTRHDVVARIPCLGLSKTGWTIFDSKHHDVHHRIPQSNYGQYTVVWDRIFGTFR